jgi:NADPH:quinone reductase-like Zn-dependent oxidoreductase
MRKVVVHAAGGYDRLRLEVAPDPVPAAGEVVVATESVGVNYADCIVRMGLYASAREFVGWPITPGFEFAGRIAARGTNAERFAIGAPVFGVTRFGAYATHVRVPERQVFALPPALSARDAAALPAVFLTAYWALFELAHPRAGAAILVHSAAGGVGTAALQLARTVPDSLVVGVVSGAHKVETAQRFGAHVVVDKTRGDLFRAARAHAPRGFDVILDANGPSTLGASYRALASPGKLVVYGFASMLPRSRDGSRRAGRPNYAKLAVDFLRTPRFSPLAMTNDNKSVLAFNLSYLFERLDVLDEGMTALARMLESGTFRPLPTAAYPLDDVARAHSDLESGATVGKLVLTSGA